MLGHEAGGADVLGEPHGSPEFIQSQTVVDFVLIVPFVYVLLYNVVLGPTLIGAAAGVVHSQPHLLRAPAYHRTCIGTSVVSSRW